MKAGGFLLAALLSGCSRVPTPPPPCRAPVVITKPIIVNKVVVKRVSIPAAQLRCRPAPKMQSQINAATLGLYISAVESAEEECRAKMAHIAKILQAQQ